MKRINQFLLSCFLIICITTSLNAQQVSKDLMLAIKETNTALLDQMISDVDLDNCFEIKNSSYNVMAMSIKMGTIASLKYFAERNASLEKSCSGKTPLMYAVKYGQLEMVQYLIEQGADMNAKNGAKSVLDYAAKYERKGIEQYLKGIKQ